MKLLKPLIYLLLIGTSIQSSCKKDPVKPVETSLRSQTLPQIKNAIRGNWQLHYSVGGITGTMRKNYTDELITFTNTDSIKWTKSGFFIKNDIIVFSKIKSIYGDSTYLLQFEDLAGGSWGWLATTLNKDTLVFVDNATNPDTYYLSKK